MRLILLLCLAFFIKTAYSLNPYEPVAIDSRIKTFIYNENEIFNLKFRIGYNSIIEFSKDEAIETISLGDPYPWKLTPLDRRLFMKAIEPGVRTNMTVITNKRVYLFEIESEVSSNIDTIDVVHVARFYYPTTAFDAMENSNLVPSKNKLQNIIEEKRTSDSVRNIGLSYRFGGEKNKATPVEIFDDGKYTYFRFVNVNNADVKIFIPKTKTQKERLRVKRTGDFLVIDGVHRQLLVEYAGNKTEIYRD